ncbi:MAG TPA: hypothetical protein PKV06_08125 [bacterium]|nr:hypothetical protein [bacterium]
MTRRAFFLWIIFAHKAVSAFAQLPELTYRMDLTSLDDDSFFVQLDIKKYPHSSALFQFPMTAPGTYAILDAGRFVGSFSALDTSGHELTVTRTSVNQFRIDEARRLARIVYKVNDSFGERIGENPIHPMGGTNIEPDNIVINGFMTFGHFSEFQNIPYRLHVTMPADWKLGTALVSKDGYLIAPTYDDLVDAPLMAGRLTTAHWTMDKTKISVYCYSEKNRVNATWLRSQLKDILNASKKFIGTLPVDRYVFLFHFREDTGPIYGALEHNYSSFYVIPEMKLEGLRPIVQSIAAHEFFHIITPLNLHSEKIVPYRFDRPTPSRHLWLYEGVTEWASDIMQVRAGVIPDSVYMQRLREKLQRNDRYKPDISLETMSLGAYDVYEDQYANIYERGALTAALLDMKLLELSDGKRGLRDVIMALVKKYGAGKSFTDSSLYGIIVDHTYPEVREFMDRYIRGSERLPIAEYLIKAGYQYESKYETTRMRNHLGLFEVMQKDTMVIVTSVDPNDSVCTRLGLQAGDIIEKMVLNNIDLPLTDVSLIEFFSFIDEGASFAWVVRRGSQTLTLNALAGRAPVIEKHRIRPISDPTPEQLRFRRIWLHIP